MENAIGGSGNDIILGTNAVDNKLVGGAGNDQLIGNGGNDTLVGGTALAGGYNYLSGGSGQDTASYEGMTQAVYADINANAGSVYNGSAYVLNDVFDSIENLRGGNAADILLGSTGANIMDGGAGADVLYGNAGAGFDAASDVFVFHTSADSLSSARDNIYNFQSGVDKLDLRDLHITAAQVSIDHSTATTVIFINADATLGYEMAINLTTAGTTAVIGDMLFV
jgi:Ca2+-binding RTX toxin-like protein